MKLQLTTRRACNDGGIKKNFNYFLFAEYANTGRGKNKIGRFLRTKSEKRK